MKAFCRLVWVEFKLYLREPTAAFFALAFPVMFLVLFGSIYGNEPIPMFGGYGTVDVSVPSYTGMIIATTGLTSLSVIVCSYRERGILRRLRTTPVRPMALLAAQAVVLLLITIAGMALLIIVGKLGYGLRFHGNPWALAGALIPSSLSFFAMGFAIAGLAPTVRTAQTVTMVLFYPMLFLSGASIPRELLPGNIQRMSEFLPLTHVVTLLRGAWFGVPLSDFKREIGILFAIAGAAALVPLRWFRWE